MGGSRDKLYKVTTGGNVHLKEIKLVRDANNKPLHIEWLSGSASFLSIPLKKGVHKIVRIDDIKSVVTGKTAGKFHRVESSEKYNPEWVFSIQHDHRERTESLDLIATSKGQFDMWVGALQQAILERNPVLSTAEQDDKRIERLFRSLDKSGDGMVSKKEVLKCTKTMNMGRLAEVTMGTLVEKHPGEFVNLDSFRKMLHKLSARPDVRALWSMLCDGSMFQGSKTFGNAVHDRISTAVASKEGIPVAGTFVDMATFKRFLLEVQGESEGTCKEIIRDVHPSGEDTVVFEDLLRYINSVANFAFDPAKRDVVYQDMSAPLSHYWIQSSHNTYLEADQLCGRSSVQQYIAALDRGCRCVELDVWDGSENEDGSVGEPIVYHGFTLTEKIYFKDCLTAIKEHGFNSTKYPVILSIENHCTVPYQQVMARHLRTLLAGMLEVPEVPLGGTLPSPQSLYGKVIVKSKKSYKPKPAEGADASTAAPQDDLDNDNDDEDDLLPAQGGQCDPLPASGVAAAAADRKSHKKKTVALAPELAEVVFLGGATFRGFDAAAANPVPPNYMASYGEKKTMALAEREPNRWIEHNKVNLSRIFPAGARVDSGNYDPIAAWNVGCQIVALNYQTPGAPMHLNHGRFLDNGGSGYVLKPPFLRGPSGPDSRPLQGPVPCTVILSVLSATNLPPPGSGRSKGETIDPFVKVSVRGAPEDEAEFETKMVENNGFDPVFNAAPHVFQLAKPELAMLYLRVKDRDTMSDDFVGYGIVPVPCLRTGFRRIQLYSNYGTMPAAFQLASLLCYIYVK
eukprot:jgi/Mesvir1/29102/Mv18408-RA.1